MYCDIKYNVSCKVDSLEIMINNVHRYVIVDPFNL